MGPRGFIGVGVLAVTTAYAGCTFELDGPITAPAPSDLGVPDVQPPVGVPCTFDQGDPSEGGCPPGLVCNVITRTCGLGRSCTSDTDCADCAELQPGGEAGRGPAFHGPCGHGYHLSASCDLSHGTSDGVGVCTRDRVLCERCRAGTRDCGRSFVPSVDGFMPNPCVQYTEELFCARSCFVSSDCATTDTLVRCVGAGGFDEPGFCFRPAGCPISADLCPAVEEYDPVRPIEQTPPGTSCGPGLGQCATNVLDGQLGVCLGDCTSNDDCPPPEDLARTTCNARSGLCVVPCTAGGECNIIGQPPQVCQPDGNCGRPCWVPDDDAQDPEELDARCGRTHPGAGRCNIPPPRLAAPGAPSRQDPQRPFTPTRDVYACAPPGCTSNEDCLDTFGRGGRVFCQKSPATGEPAECVEGCQAQLDCSADEVCRIGPTDARPEPEDCTDLLELDATRPEAVGVCCPASS